MEIANLAEMEAAQRFLAEGDDFLLTSHVNSDGDGIGGCLALRRLLQKLDKKAVVVLPDAPDRRYEFLEDWKTIRQADSLPPGEVRCAIVLDCPSLERLGDLQRRIDQRTRILNVDHHQDNASFGEVNLVSPAVSSSSEMIYHLIAAMGQKIDAAMAAQLYAGILFDTGGFRFSLTTPTTFEVAAALVRCGIPLDRIADRIFGHKSLAEVKQLGRAIDSLALHFGGRVAVMRLTCEEMGAGDPEEVVNYGLLVNGVEVAVLIREMEPGRFRVSLRSREQVNVNPIAARFGGGGHIRASGCRLAGTWEEVERKLLAAIREALPRE